jgi:hypothetical protein
VGVGSESKWLNVHYWHGFSGLLRVGVISKAPWHGLIILTLSNVITKVNYPKRG